MTREPVLKRGTETVPKPSNQGIPKCNRETALTGSNPPPDLAIRDRIREMLATKAMVKVTAMLKVTNHVALVVSTVTPKPPNLFGPDTHAEITTRTIMQRKLGPRAEYLQREHQRVKESTSLLERYKELKSLTVEVAYFESETEARRGEMKYTVNLDHAKSLFRFSCPNGECVGGDFDLSTELANAVANREEEVIGKMVCQGWRSRTTIGTVLCHNILRYKLSIGY
jgi:hypothetical protein